MKTRKYPALEMAAAGSVLQFWSERLSDAGTSQKRRTELEKKLPAIQKAIAGNIKKGKQASLPHEVVRDEFNAIHEQAVLLYDKVGQAANVADAEALLTKAKFVYGDSVREYCRPALVSRQSPDDLARRIRGKRKEKSAGAIETLSRKQFPAFIVGDLFGATSRTVRDKIKQQGREASWHETSPIQRYLVAMYVVGGRRGDVAESDLLQIQQALVESGYVALGVYHLAKFVSQGTTPVEVAFPQSAVREACRELQQSRRSE